MRLNERWSFELLSDELACGGRVRILTAVDDCARECLALVADYSLSGVRVARELDRLVAELGCAADDRQRQWREADLERDTLLGK